MANSRTGDSVVGRVVRVLESFDSTRVAQTPAQIARRTGLPTSTAHRLVGNLVESGLLERDDRGEVRVGMRLWELTTRGSHALGLRQIALPFMTELQAQVREHTQLAVLEHDEVLFIERLSSRDAVTNITKIAGRLPLHASSSGLVLLAHATAEHQEHILVGRLAPVSAETIVDPVILRRKLSEIRRLGYASAPGSIEAVSTGIAVPVSDASEVVAALGVVVPRGADTQQTVARLITVAAEISAALAVSRFASH